MTINTLALETLKRHEGLRLTPYKDTIGKWTIGYGLNLDAGITEGEAEWLLTRRMERAEQDARKYFDRFDELNEVRQAVLINMAYNLGLTRLITFRQLRMRLGEALDSNTPADWHLCAEEMLDSRWAAQVGRRSEELAKAMALGKLTQGGQ